MQVETRIVIRDNGSERSVQIDTDLPRGDIRFLNEIGERVAQETGYAIVLLAVESQE